MCKHQGRLWVSCKLDQVLVRWVPNFLDLSDSSTSHEGTQYKTSPSNLSDCSLRVPSPKPSLSNWTGDSFPLEMFQRLIELGSKKQTWLQVTQMQQATTQGTVGQHNLNNHACNWILSPNYPKSNQTSWWEINFKLLLSGRFFFFTVVFCFVLLFFFYKSIFDCFKAIHSRHV